MKIRVMPMVVDTMEEITSILEVKGFGNKHSSDHSTIENQNPKDSPKALKKFGVTFSIVNCWGVKTQWVTWHQQKQSYYNIHYGSVWNQNNITIKFTIPLVIYVIS